MFLLRVVREAGKVKIRENKFFWVGLVFAFLALVATLGIFASTKTDIKWASKDAFITYGIGYSYGDAEDCGPDNPNGQLCDGNTQYVRYFENFVPDYDMLYVLGGYVAFVLVILAWTFFHKLYRRCTRLSPVNSGALRYYAAKGDVSALELIKKQKHFHVDNDYDGFTALHAASVAGHAHVVAWLIENGANVDAVKRDGWMDTALHYAASKGHFSVVKLLVEAGALQTYNFNNQTPADLAREQGFPLIAAFLDGEILADEEMDSLNSIPAPPTDSSNSDWVLRKRFDGAGTFNTVDYPNKKLTRTFLFFNIVLAIIYIAWRAIRTLNPKAKVFSLIFFVCELFLTHEFLLWLVLAWAPITRPVLKMNEYVKNHSEYPSVDVYICTYNEDLEVIRNTTLAALKLHYAAKMLHVFVLDDGKRESVRELVDIVNLELKSKLKRVKLTYVARAKVKGVHHHAKAGNINNCLNKVAESTGKFILVLDCDMVVTKNLLYHAMPHFYEPIDGDDLTKGFRLKEKAAMLQIPQSFYNLGKEDRFWQCSEDFYATMLEGADGIGAAPCVGTGVLFRRECLLALGGQCLWSVTEDFKTSMHLIASGFSTMYLFQNLVFGIAVEDAVGIYKQRMRWSTGGLQILLDSNPIFTDGLSFVVTCFFFANAMQYLLSIPTIFVIITPYVYFVAGIAPIYIMLLELTVFLGTFYLASRLFQWWQLRFLPKNIDNCLWRGCQQIVWLAPIYLESIISLAYTLTLKKWILQTVSIEFVTSSKNKAMNRFWDIFRVSWFCILLYVALFVGVIYNIYTVATGITLVGLFVYMQWLIGFFLCAVTCLMAYPAIAELFDTTPETAGYMHWDIDPNIIKEANEMNFHSASIQIAPRMPPSLLAQQSKPLNPDAIESNSSGSENDSAVSSSVEASFVYMEPKFVLVKPEQSHWTFRIVFFLNFIIMVIIAPLCGAIILGNWQFLTY